MDLTPENKSYINELSCEELLSHWRFAPIGDKWFQGETGDYWKRRMKEQREKHQNPVAVSKAVGW